MPFPSRCPNPECHNHRSPERQWLVKFGSYPTSAHGRVQRYRCKRCGATTSDQTESLHFFAKRRLPLRAITNAIVAGASLREVAKRYGFSQMAVHNAVLRLGRQAMAAQTILLSECSPRTDLVIDGLRSFVTSQDYPCDITTTVDREGETILGMVHSISRRGGRTRPEQKARIERKYRLWMPEKGSVKRDISLLFNEIWDYFRPSGFSVSSVHTDENPLYASLLANDPIMNHFEVCNQAHHYQTSGTEPRTQGNPLFPVNYVDRLLRHRVKEHVRETLAFGRNATMQMHRAWIFAWDHNFRREHRAKERNPRAHAVFGTVDQRTARCCTTEFFVRRLRVRNNSMPESIRRVWMGEIQTPPVRWRVEQKNNSVRVPSFALADIQQETNNLVDTVRS